MNAEILSVGTELLMGQIANTDAQYLSQQLSELGINVYYHTVVGDNARRLKDTLAMLLSRSDIIITTGGLGPTMDDLTKETIAEYLGLQMTCHQPTLDAMTSFFSNIHRTMTPNNAKQADFPVGSMILPNPNGTAPGCIIEHQGKSIIILPGPPHELQPMFRDSVRPYLENKSGYRIVSRILNVTGAGESEVEYRLREIIANQTNPTIAPYASPGKVTLRITARVEEGEEAQALLDPMVASVHDILGDNIYTDCDESLAEVVIDLLKTQGKTIAVAESCTGGLLASAFVDVPGASVVFLEGMVTYSNDAKIQRLGVREETIRDFGAVSEQTAREMAMQLKRIANTDLAIATTGVAGPDGGTPEKPVGLIYIALAYDNCCQVIESRMRRSRTQNRNYTCILALDLARRFLLTQRKEGKE